MHPSVGWFCSLINQNLALNLIAAAALTKPAEGEKEGMTHKAQRKWQEKEKEARTNKKGFKVSFCTSCRRREANRFKSPMSLG